MLKFLRSNLDSNNVKLRPRETVLAHYQIETLKRKSNGSSGVQSSQLIYYK